MARLTQYLKGSTLVETIISMTLIVIILGASFTALTGIAHSTLNQVRFKARFVVKGLLSEDLLVRNADTLQTDFGGFFIEQELLPYDDTDNLQTLVVNAVTPDGRIIYTGRRLIVRTDE